MATRYTSTCDACGLVINGRDEMGKYQPELDEYNKNQWTINIDNHWFEDRDGGCKEMMKAVEFRAEACLECAKLIGNAIRDRIAIIKTNA